jgi:hypothetical protein
VERLDSDREFELADLSDRADVPAKIGRSVPCAIASYSRHSLGRSPRRPTLSAPFEQFPEASDEVGRADVSQRVLDKSFSLDDRTRVRRLYDPTSRAEDVAYFTEHHGVSFVRLRRC